MVDNSKQRTYALDNKDGKRSEGETGGVTAPRLSLIALTCIELRVVTATRASGAEFFSRRNSNIRYL